jgi:predicted AlkP superfamily phosphohydrolase/phosphomutase
VSSALARDRRPLVIFAVDALGAEAGEAWARDGLLPNIAAIMRRGCFGRIAGRELVSPQGAWLTFFSGSSPHEHGFYFNRRLRPGTYEAERITAREAPALPFWSRLRHERRPVAIVDARETYPLADLPGCQLANWAGVKSFNTARASRLAEPPSLLEEARRVAGDPIEMSAYEPGAALREEQRAQRAFVKRVEQKGTFSLHVLKKAAFDLVVIGFSDGHSSSHRFWDYRPAGRRHREVAAQNCGLEGAIGEVYRAIDREIGRLLAELPADSNVFVVSMFGMKDQFPTEDLVETFCKHLGYQAIAQRGRSGWSPLAWARRAVPLQWRASLSRRLPLTIQHRLQADRFASEADWPKTRAFALPSINTGFLRVNLRGREPEGIVDPNGEYGELLDEIEAELRKLTDARTGERLVERITRTATFSGGPPALLPDLFVEWIACDHFMDGISHPRAEWARGEPWFDRSSYHSLRGFMAAAGPSIAARGSVGEMEILDFAPTFLRLLDVQPDGPRGRVLGELIDPAARSTEERGTPA